MYSALGGERFVLIAQHMVTGRKRRDVDLADALFGKARWVVTLKLPASGCRRRPSTTSLPTGKRAGTRLSQAGMYALTGRYQRV